MKKWIRPNFTPCLPLGDHQSRITESQKHRALSRTAAGEGIVLLKNNHKLLPLPKGAKVAMFGKSQIDYVKGGGGSGDVTVSYVRNLYQGLKEKSPFLEVFDPLSLYYQEYTQSQYKEGAQPGLVKEAPLPSALLSQAREFTDTALIVIGRYSGEGWDRKNDGTDDYFNLSTEEMAMVKAVTETFPQVAVLLNVGAMIDTSWFAANDRISAAAIIWQGGMEGGLAAADMLTGEINPSGHLADTCAASFDDYPSSRGFHESEDCVKYEEDIFVGYRFFETIPGKKEAVIYPFGYGLSYTTFQLADLRGCDDGKTVFLSMTVTNTGTRAGKEVVQVYCCPPEGKLSKPSRVLCGFEKTKLLLPGESQELTISFPIQAMASFDDTGVLSLSSFVLEKGKYTLYVGENVREAKEISYAFSLKEEMVIEKLHSFCSPRKLDRRLQADGSFELLSLNKDSSRYASFSNSMAYASSCERLNPSEKECPGSQQQASLLQPDGEYSLMDVAEGKISLEAFLEQLTDEELCRLTAGCPSRGVANTGGIGGVSRLGIPAVMTADGPAGVRIRRECGVNTTAFPIATALAATWNLSLVEEVGRAGALEAKENNLSIWLTPALNIHRSPLCGRNFEYYSEDPFLAGKMAAAMVKGIQSENIAAVPKHFACNNKETNRKESDSIVSERALREIYLKGFEICVKEAKPRLIMTSYNLVNGVRTSENKELITGILREEWGFDGLVISDWGNHGDHEQELKAGNDVKMPKGTPEKLMDALKAGTLSRSELSVSAKRVLEMILWLE